MQWKPKIKALILVAGDLAALYVALALTLAVRTSPGQAAALFAQQHVAPFTVMFVFWIIVFYIAGLYDIRRMRNTLEFFKTLCLAIVINAAFSVAFFYLVPIFGITPKVTLFLFLMLFTGLELSWRPWFNRRIARGEASIRIILVGEGETANLINEVIAQNPQMGYEVRTWFNESTDKLEAEQLHEAIRTHRAHMILIPRSLKQNSQLINLFYALLSTGVEVKDFPNFYEDLFRKVPLSELEESWFLEHLTEHQKYYDPIKRLLEFFGALALQIVLLPLEIIIALLVKLTSPGPAIYAQQRVGRSGQLFTLYKFRTMYKNAEARGVQWSQANDTRVTPLGKFLRATHLDELPQLVNILRGDLSFVGPRPERPEFVDLLKEAIPHYQLRHLVAPGLTGWAQVNYRYGASVEDAMEKLQYEIYYLKNRSLTLDLAIILKSVKLFFVSAQ